MLTINAAIAAKSKINPDADSSLKKYLNGESNQIHEKGYVFGFEHSGYSFIMRDNWKLVNYKTPFNIKN